MALGGDFVGAADYPGVFRRAILAELDQELLKRYPASAEYVRDGSG